MPPPVNAQHAQKYDRQIRIWGDDGQAALQRASVCVLNASATATELLKNLVLPGLASFTLIDGQSVTSADRATNFFLRAPDDAEGEGPPRNRAAAVMAAMRKLNPTVRASYVPADPATVLCSADATHALLRHFTVVVATQLSPLSPVLSRVAAACAALRVPLLVVRSYGLAATVRLQLVDHVVRDARADLAPDLRLHAPFDELRAHATSDVLRPVDSGTPFALLLLRALSTFRDEHAGCLPQSRADKDRFRHLIVAQRPETCPPDTDNFAEALRFANLRLCHADAGTTPRAARRVLTDYRSDPELSDAFAPPPLPAAHAADPDPAAAAVAHAAKRGDVDTAGDGDAMVDAEGAGRARARWWLCAAAVRLFEQRHGALPVCAAIPDMASSTDSYVALQRVYAARARCDVDHVAQLVREITASRGLSDANVPREEVAVFCKRVRAMRVLRSRTLAAELGQDETARDGADGDGDGDDFKRAAMEEGALDEAVSSACASPLYVMLRAADRFEVEHGRVPGGLPAMAARDARVMQALVARERELVGVSVPGAAAWREITDEVVRFAGVELASVAAFCGGVAAQEVIKIVTGQFVPVLDTVVFNMMSMTSITFRA